MPKDIVIDQHNTHSTNTVDTYSFKTIEKFSKDVCVSLATVSGNEFQRSSIVYGLTAFLSVVKQALEAK